jgi:hypothetical protein
MNNNHLLCWNVRGLNSRARRNVVRTVVTQQRASVVCVQESKIENFSVSMNLEITGFDFDYISLPATGFAGERSVRDALNDYRWTRDISGAPTAAVLAEYIRLWDAVELVQLSPRTPDRFVWKWSATGNYTASSAYRAFFIGMASLPGAQLIWKAIVPPKVKFFFWLALHGRLWTAERRRRHGLQQDGTCVLCDQSEETTNHLLCSCTVTRELWVRLLSPAGFLHLAPLQGSTLVDWWLQARVGMPADGRRAFDSLTLVTSWILWKERNKRTFEGLARSTAQLFRAVTDELEEYVAAGYHGLTPLLLAIGQ